MGQISLPHITEWRMKIMDVTETTKKKTLTKDEIIQELMDMLKQNNMQAQSNEVFEICSYVDGLEKSWIV
jgi:hypothetical protein